MLWEKMDLRLQGYLNLVFLNNLVQLPHQTAVQYRKSGGMGK